MPLQEALLSLGEGGNLFVIKSEWCRAPLCQAFFLVRSAATKTAVFILFEYWDYIEKILQDHYLNLNRCFYGLYIFVKGFLGAQVFGGNMKWKKPCHCCKAALNSGTCVCVWHLCEFRMLFKFLVGGHCIIIPDVFSRWNAIWIGIHIPKSNPNQLLHDWRYITRHNHNPWNLLNWRFPVRSFNDGPSHIWRRVARVSPVWWKIWKSQEAEKFWSTTISSAFWQEYQLGLAMLSVTSSAFFWRGTIYLQGGPRDALVDRLR